MKRIWLWFGIIIICFGITGCGENRKAKGILKTESYDGAGSHGADTVQLSGSDIHVTVRFGMNGYVRFNRYMAVSAELTNDGDDFSGWIQVVFPMDGENSMYQKEFNIKPQQTKKVILYLPACMNQNQMLFSVNDSKGESICSRELSASMVFGTDTEFIGIFSDKQAQMGYLDGPDSQIFYLKKSDFTADYKALDILDIIVISDKDIRDFSSQKIKAIIAWVKRGGTLVLADSGQEWEFKPFDGKLLSWRVQGKQKIKTSFGLRMSDISVIQKRVIEGIEAEKAEKVKKFLKENLSRGVYDSWRYEIEDIQENPQCLEKSGEIFTNLMDKYSEEKIKEKLSLSATEEEKVKALAYIKIPLIEKKLSRLSVKESEILISTEDKEVLIQKVQKGLGNVIVAGCSLALKKETWDVLGSEILEQVEKNLSEQKKRQLQTERDQGFGKGNYIYQQGLLITDTDNLPNLKLYAVILIIYVIFVGPVLFLVFRKKEKSTMLWGVIPAAAVLFSVFIYLIGTSTRIQGPYVNYLSHMHLEDDGQAVLSTWIRLVSNQNQNYEMVLDGNCDIEPFHGEQDYYSDGNTETNLLKQEYQYGIEYGNTQTKISLEDLSAFEGKDFKDQELVNCKGDIKADIVSDDMMLRGNVTNEFSYDLEDCFLYDNGTVYYIGNIKSGETVSLEKINSKQIYLQSEYNYDNDELMMKLFGTNCWNSGKEDVDSVLRRRSVLAEGYLEKELTSDSYFWGFASRDSNPENQFMDKIPFNQFGVMGISKDIDIKYTSNGMEVLPDISKYAVSYDDNVTDGKSIYDTNQHRIQVSYKLPKGYQWKGLAYNQSNNAEFSYYSNGYMSSAIFSGIVTMVNPTVGQEIQILESGIEMNMELNPECLNEDGVLTLYYYLDKSVDYELQLPNIMAYVTKK